MSTVLAVDGGWGDGARLKVAVSKALPLVQEARHNMNVTTLVVMGNVAGSGDATEVARSTEIAVQFKARRVLLVSSFDLACLRLRDRGIKGELVTPPSGDDDGMLVAARVLQAPAPLPATRDEPLPDLWTLHNAECAAAFQPLEDRQESFATDQQKADATAIALLLKMASMMDRMLHAGGIYGMLAQSIDRLEAKSLEPLKQQLGSMVNMPDLYSRYVDLKSQPPRITPAGEEIRLDAARVVRDIVNWATRGGFDSYMQSARLVAFVPCSDAEPPDSLRGTWFAASGMGQLDGDGSIVGKLLADGDVAGKRFRVTWTEPSKPPLSPRDWERDLAEQFTQFYSDFQAGTENARLWRAIVALGCTKSDSGPTDSPSVMPMPSEFGPRAVGIFGASRVDAVAAPPVALAERMIKWTRDDYPISMSRWVRLARGGVSWAVVSHCPSTALAVSPYPELLARNVPFSKLQFDVSVALASLLEFKDHTARDPAKRTPFKNAVHNLQGVLGPCVRMGVDGQTHRVCWWNARGVGGGVVMLLPELYMRLAFPDYLTSPEHQGPCAVACGFLALSLKDVVPLQVQGLQIEDVEPRVFWMRGSRHWSDATTGEALAAMQSARDARGHLMRLVTREQANSPMGLAPGQELGDSSLYKLYYYSSSSTEGLAGMRVRITFANGNRAAPTLDADTSGESGLQTEFESFVRSEE